MKKITLSIFVSIFAVGSVFSQADINQEKTTLKQEKTNLKQEGKKVDAIARAEKVAERLQSELGLSDEVKEKVNQLNITRFTQIKELKEKYAGDMKDHKAELEAVRNNYKKSLAGLLTPNN